MEVTLDRVSNGDDMVRFTSETCQAVLALCMKLIDFKYNTSTIVKV